LPNFFIEGPCPLASPSSAPWMFFRVKYEVTNRWMGTGFVKKKPLASCATLPGLSTADMKAWKTELESTLHRKLSAVSGSRIQALLAQRRKPRKFSAPSSLESIDSASTMLLSGPVKGDSEEDDKDDDYEENPYEYVRCCRFGPG